MKNILLIKLSALGDVIHALPVSYAIKETYPDAKLTWVVEPQSQEIVEMNPCVDEIITFYKKDFKTFRGFWRNLIPFRREIQDEKYDVVLDLQGLFKSAAIAFFAKSKLKIGTCDMREGSDKISKRIVGEHSAGHVVDRYLDSARAIGCKVDEVKFPLIIPDEVEIETKELLASEGVQIDNPYVVLVVGASWATKRWKAEYFAAMSEWLYDNRVTPVLVGSGTIDSFIANQVYDAMEVPPVNLVGRLNLKQLAFTLENARLVIGADTGPTHLAVALETRTIMLMGATNPRRTGSYDQQENIMLVDRPCKICMKKICPKQADCLERITPEMVQQKIMEMR